MAASYQIFALNTDNRLVSAADVDRGLACNCTCQLCGDALVAKQGNIRTWHFAHQGNSDCSGGPETLLHQAAKQVILEACSIQVPAVVIGRSIKDDQGLMRHGKAIRPAGLMGYKDPRKEIAHGVVRPDVQVTAEFGLVFLEIAVTNPISGSKFARLLDLGIPTMEITLNLPKNPGQNAWDAVRQAVLYAPNNRRWVVLPEVERLSAEAIANAELLPTPAVKAINNFQLGRTTVHLQAGQKWLSVRVTTSDFAIDPLVSAWLVRWGGRFDDKRQLWWFRADCSERLRTALTTLAQRISQQSAAEQHQRVLDAYYQAHE